MLVLIKFKNSKMLWSIFESQNISNLCHNQHKKNQVNVCVTTQEIPGTF